MLEIEVTCKDNYDHPYEWDVKDWNAGGEIIGTIYADGAANAVYVNMRRPFKFSFEAEASSIKVPSDYTEPFQDTVVELSKDEKSVVIRSYWKWLDVVVVG